MYSVWTDQTVEELTKYLVDGLSSSQIAARMHITRNAVIGKIHRLGLQLGNVGRPRSSQPTTSTTRRAPRRRYAVPEAAIPLAPGANHPVTLMELGPNDCCAIISEGNAPVLYCGRTRGLDFIGTRSSYCAHHHALFHA